MILSKIDNFRGVKSAEFELEKGLTGFFGKNGAGKSSIAQSLTSLGEPPEHSIQFLLMDFSGVKLFINSPHF